MFQWYGELYAEYRKYQEHPLAPTIAEFEYRDK
jgi:hypothetical protein